MAVSPWGCLDTHTDRQTHFPRLHVSLYLSLSFFAAVFTVQWHTIGLRSWSSMVVRGNCLILLSHIQLEKRKAMREIKHCNDSNEWLEGKASNNVSLVEKDYLVWASCAVYSNEAGATTWSSFRRFSHTVTQSYEEAGGEWRRHTHPCLHRWSRGGAGEQF